MSDEIVAKQYDLFVSYARADDEAREVLVAALEAEGYQVWWDTQLVAGAPWREQIRDRINGSRVVLALWSERAAESDELKSEMSHAYGTKKLVGVKLDASPTPRSLRDNNFLLFDAWQDPVRRTEQLMRIVDAVREMGIGRSLRPAADAALMPIPVELGDLPAAPPRLVGREVEMAMLRRAWASRAPSKVNVVVLHGLGGAGKSALLRTFVNDLLSRGGDGATRIYGWSAYSQGSGEQKRADTDGFFQRALGDFGYRGPPIMDAIERARSLARFVQRERVLLVLDGLDPLQDPPDVNKGRFTDRSLSELVRALAYQNPGLVVLTTRQEVPELEGHGPLVISHPLSSLSDKAGADLLVELGVRGRQRELEAAVRSVDGHALSVTLLGTYLSDVCGGDIRNRDQFDFADIVLAKAEQEELATDRTTIAAKRSAKLIAGYVAMFEARGPNDANGRGGSELALLHVVGLFDRAADGPAVKALLARRIPGLTDALFIEPGEARVLSIGRRAEREVSPAERTRRLRMAKSRLFRLRLISSTDPSDPDALDAHPMVRAYFAGRLQETMPEAARSAHDILYRHYADAAPDLPDTLANMQPLFHAVRHGVAAGLAQDTFEAVLRRRIDRGSELYLCRSLGAFGPWLATLAHFFEEPWGAPRRDLSNSAQAWLLGSVAFALTALGRLGDAVEPHRTHLAQEVARGDWRAAAISAASLCDTLLILGNVARAMEAAQEAVKFADQSGEVWLRRTCRVELMRGLQATGDLTRAAELLQEIGAMIRADRSDGPSAAGP